MECKMLLLFCCLIGLVTGEKRGHDRKSRIISFDKTKDDIEVSLDFTVPFLSIPIKKTINSMFDGLPGLAIPSINLNPSALAFGSFIILATSVLLPIFSKSFSGYNTGQYYKVLDNESAETNILKDFTNQFLSVSSGCPLRIACWMSQRTNDLASTKTVEQIIRNKLISSILNTSSIEEAITKGRRGHDCTIYEPCPMYEKHLSMIMKNLDILTSRNGT